MLYVLLRIFGKILLGATTWLACVAWAPSLVTPMYSMSRDVRSLSCCVSAVCSDTAHMVPSSTCVVVPSLFFLVYGRKYTVVPRSFCEEISILPNATLLHLERRAAGGVSTSTVDDEV